MKDKKRIYTLKTYVIANGSEAILAGFIRLLRSSQGKKGVIKENGWLNHDEIVEENYFTYYFFIYGK